MSAPVTTITTRKQWAQYLQTEARRMVQLQYEQSVLRELVAEAYAVKERMPKDWNSRAKKALAQIKE